MSGFAPNDLEAFWLPFTPNREFRRAPRLLVGAEGVWYRTADGRRVLDAAAGLWCCNAGHGHPRIVEAIRRRAGVLDYAPPFQFAHPDAFTLAARLRDLFPGDLDHAFFCNSGSEAVDTALKIALAYHRARGEGQRVRLIGRARGYHGVGFGGLSVGGIGANRRLFGPLLPGVDHLPHTLLEANRFARGRPPRGAELADALEDLLERHGPETVAAVIVEPVAGSIGVYPPPVGYLERLREITARHGILLIFDEVITAFGRLGAGSAAEALGVRPDMITLAKGLTSGTVPMGGVMVRREIHRVLVEESPAPEWGIELPHGYTYSAHPLATAAALATLDVYRDEDLFARAAALAPVFEERLHAMRDAPHVRDIRNLGLMGAVELEPRPGAPGARGFHAMRRAFFGHDLLIRVTGDTIALSPPLVTGEAELELLFARLEAVLRELD